MGDRERRHIGELDEAEGQFILVLVQHVGLRVRHDEERGGHRAEQGFHVRHLRVRRPVGGQGETQKKADQHPCRAGGAADVRAALLEILLGKELADKVRSHSSRG